jgi:hypothetical protein
MATKKADAASSKGKSGKPGLNVPPAKGAAKKTPPKKGGKK